MYLCKRTGWFGIGYFLDQNPHEIWPDAIRGTRVFKELVSLGPDLNAVGPEKIVELRERMLFNVKRAMETIKAYERRRLDQLQLQEAENHSIRRWLTQETGHAAPTSLWDRNKIRFSFAGKGGSKARKATVRPTFAGIED